MTSLTTCWSRPRPSAWPKRPFKNWGCHVDNAFLPKLVYQHGKDLRSWRSLLLSHLSNFYSVMIFSGLEQTEQLLSRLPTVLGSEELGKSPKPEVLLRFQHQSYCNGWNDAATVQSFWVMPEARDRVATLNSFDPTTSPTTRMATRIISSSWPRSGTLWLFKPTRRVRARLPQMISCESSRKSFPRSRVHCSKHFWLRFVPFIDTILPTREYGALKTNLDKPLLTSFSQYCNKSNDQRFILIY